MRTLNRPMFNMGGPIKQGVMHGIREPYKGGGKAALVGNPVYPKTGGREHHWINIPLQLAAAGIRSAPTIWRGMKTARMFTPWKQNLGKWNRFKDIFLPSGRFKNVAAQKGKDPSAAFIKGDPSAFPGRAGTPASKLGFWKSMRDPKRIGAAIGENPFTAFGVASLAPQAGYAGYKVAKAAPGTLWEGAKRYADLVIPGDQSSWYTPKEPPTGIEKPGGYPKATVTEKGKELTSAERDAFAKSQRDARVQKYMDLMGYDRSKKTAIADALIDASKIVSDRGTLDRKNITGELINPIIQAVSKRLDKPEQIREAVGLMMTKAGLEKELYDAKPGTIMKNAQDLVKTGKYTLDEAIAISTKGSKGLVDDLQAAISTGKVDAANWPSFVMSTGAVHDTPVTYVTDAQLKEQYKDLDKLPSAMEIIANEGIEDDGVYVIGQETVIIKDGKKTKIRG